MYGGNTLKAKKAPKKEEAPAAKYASAAVKTVIY